jgi:hypothetical protein
MVERDDQRPRNSGMLMEQGGESGCREEQGAGLGERGDRLAGRQAREGALAASDVVPLENRSRLVTCGSSGVRRRVRIR